VHYPPIHEFSHYHELPTRRSLPHTGAVAPRLLTLPLFPPLSEQQVDEVVDALLEAL